MVWLKTFLARVGALFHKRRFDKELEEELGFHLEMEAGQNLRNGMSPTEAQRAARLSLGNPELVKEDCRDAPKLCLAGSFPTRSPLCNAHASPQPRVHSSRRTDIGPGEWAQSQPSSVL